MLRGVIGLQDPGLRLVCLTEGITALFAHTLDLSHLADGLLELFHATTHLLAMIQVIETDKEGRKHTEADNPGYCTSGSPGYGDTFEGSTSS